jgi:uncharacterized protein (DUF488 family)
MPSHAVGSLCGIDYVPLPALGGLRHARKDSPNTGWRNTSFRGCADCMQTEAFEDRLDTLIDMSRQQRTAIMCAEAVPWRCHRSLVAETRWMSPLRPVLPTLLALATAEKVGSLWSIAGMMWASSP